MLPRNSKLTHEAAKSLESAGYADMRVNFDQHAFRGVNVYLKEACFVEGRIKESQETLR